MSATINNMAELRSATLDAELNADGSVRKPRPGFNDTLLASHIFQIQLLDLGLGTGSEKKFRMKRLIKVQR